MSLYIAAAGERALGDIRKSRNVQICNAFRTIPDSGTTHDWWINSVPVWANIQIWFFCASEHATAGGVSWRR